VSEPVARKRISLLLVEDDQIDRLACRRALAAHPDYDFELIEAETGREGVMQALAYHPDLVLLDYHLPDLDGLDFLAELQREGDEMPVPVMMLTGADNAGVAVEAMRRGARDYLVKDRERNYLTLLPAVIERVLREQRLRLDKRAAEVRFRTLVEQIPAITYMAAPDGSGRLLYISPQAQNLGYTADEWLALPHGLLSAIHPHDRAAVQLAYTQSCATGQPLRCEYRVATRQGETRWLLDEARIVRDAEEVPLYLQGVLIDITEDKRREAELQAHRLHLEEMVAERTVELDSRNALLEDANARLSRQIEERERAETAARQYADEVRDLYNQAPCGYHSLDPEGRVTRINDTELQWLGYTREAVIGRPFSEFLSPSSAQRFGDNFARFKASGEVYNLEVEMQRKDGSILPVEVNSTAVKDAAGNYLTSRSTLFDVSARMAAEQALRTSEARFRLLLESAGEGIYGLDTEGRCIFVNDAALEMLGYTREELIGQPTHPRIHHSHDDGTPYDDAECSIYDAFRSGVARRNMIEPMWRKDGSMLIAEYSAYPLRENEVISGAVLVFRDVTESQALANQLAWQASHDALTGLVNRQEFERRLARAVESVHRDGGIHALCYLDLDQFKVVNDTCGHAAGDELLRQISTLLEGRMRQRDTLARLGGDEFGILLEHCPADKAMQLALEVRDAVRDFRFSWQGRSFTVGASLGVAPLTASVESAAAAMSAADAACYVAKEQGRNRAHLYQADDVNLAEHRNQMQWVSRLTQALDDDRFRLYYQSIVPLNASTAARPHHEVLLRLQETDGRLVEPMAFVPAAERYNLMPAIDRWVLREVIRSSAAAQRLAMPRPRFAVNLSGRSLLDERLPEYLAGLLTSYEVPGDMLCLEITEAAAVENLARASQRIGEFKRLGCSVALDHFGSGMSSFTDLRTLPVDFLKIDGGFIRSLAEDRLNRAVAEAINRVAHVMTIQTVAECTETAAVVTVLKELGIDHAQGYVLGMPQPIESLVVAPNTA
jgi:diguanylate cyclase (GGDEF)-like protein/PAS domain S-box-containing protein